jgi:predicted glycogen debranching enzyme
MDAGVCRDFERASHLEWIQSNGTGAFAMGTVAGINTRRYHSLFLTSLNPPVKRYVLLSRVEEEVEVAGVRYALGASQYPGIVDPAGYQHLQQFRLDPYPIWTYSTGPATLTKQFAMVQGRQSVMLSYTCSQRARLCLRVFLAFREYHSLQHKREDFDGTPRVAETCVSFKPFAELPEMRLEHCGGQFQPEPNWYFNNEYLRDFERGADYREDLFSPGLLSFELNPNQPAWVMATTEPLRSALTAESIAEVFQQERSRRQVRARNTFIGRLTAAADQFKAKRADGHDTLLAGYPWFADWGRDTMISIPGIFISRGLLEDARKMIVAFLHHLDKGLIPDRFAETGHEPQYNTADATLWMFYAVYLYEKYGGDMDFVRNAFYPKVKEIIGWHRRGTHFGIHVDASDGLLVAAHPGVQLTWMDAKTGDHVWTPRMGKPVEIEALWYNALKMAELWSTAMKDTGYAEQLRVWAGQVLQSFRAKFWNPKRNCLYDVISTDGEPDAKIRPNQIFAVSLPFPLLEQEQQRAVVSVVQKELLTPVGLRSLSPNDPDYKGRYEGDLPHRDDAYHNGTVWPYLMGPFVYAYLTAFGRSPESLQYCRRLISHFEPELTADGLGTLNEIYDGDPPHRPVGCVGQMWSVAEILRAATDLDAFG